MHPIRRFIRSRLPIHPSFLQMIRLRIRQWRYGLPLTYGQLPPSLAKRRWYHLGGSALPAIAPQSCRPFV